MKTHREYTNITPREAGQLLVENDMKEVYGFAFRDSNDSEYSTIRALKNVTNIDHAIVFQDHLGNIWRQCAMVKEIDPVKRAWRKYIGYKNSNYIDEHFLAGWHAALEYKDPQK